MKGSRNENNKQSKQGHVNMGKPNVRDDMDSRKEKEINPNKAGNEFVPINANKPIKKKKKTL
jgi:hypothetical protein